MFICKHNEKLLKFFNLHTAIWFDCFPTVLKQIKKDEKKKEKLERLSTNKYCNGWKRVNQIFLNM